MSSKRGFTLIELMVVITIIAILSIIGITAYTFTQKSARDARRRSDVDAIANTLETHYGDTDTSCAASGTEPYCTTAASTWGPFFNGNVLPANPGPGGTTYSITFPASGGKKSYTVCALLENNNGNSSTTGDGTNFTAASGSSGTYYCRKNTQ